MSSSMSCASASVAVGFIFELDETLYGHILSYQRRCEFEAEDANLHPPRRTAVIANLCRQNRLFGVHTFCSLIAVIRHVHDVPEAPRKLIFLQSYRDEAPITTLRVSNGIREAPDLGFHVIVQP